MLVDPADPFVGGRLYPQETTVARGLATHLSHLGVERAFGVTGGAIAVLFDAFSESPIRVHHCRHETGAAFAAAEAFFVDGKPTVVFSTTGPGMLNVLNGMTAAKWDGAKVILISGATDAALRGRWATQETSGYSLPLDTLYTAGPLFDFALRMESAAELPEVLHRLSLGLARPGGFVAHVCLPSQLQMARLELSPPRHRMKINPPMVDHDDLREYAALLANDRFAVWAGFGAVKAADKVRALVERTGSKVFCSPRAKGVVDEDHPQFLGVTGIGGHERVVDYMVHHKPDWVLVLGTRLGEATSFWDHDMVPLKGFLHVDLDPEVPGTAFPEHHTIGIHADVGRFLAALTPLLPQKEPTITLMNRGGSNVLPMPLRWSAKNAAADDDQPQDGTSGGMHGRVRPQVLMDALQRNVIDRSDALVMGECGNSFAWCNHHLRFRNPNRYRVSPRYGSMGHCAAGAVGAALALDGPAVAVVGDGSMLMNCEISTAVQYGAHAVWVVLNDAAYGMCRAGQNTLGLSEESTDIPQVDFVHMARSLGADGLTVKDEGALDVAFQKAMAADGPFVLDVLVDPDQPSPLIKRFESLIDQGNSKHVAGWER